MDTITGKGLYEKTCPPGQLNVITGGLNFSWDDLSNSVKFAWERTAEHMEKIRQEERK